MGHQKVPLVVLAAIVVMIVAIIVAPWILQP